ncbi:M15 family metallopeptidase [Neobacillus cucumis]|uniref:M15 family metallopeptidase n=1 Tax=Neobacillus cucumis TaxID=1740721 RepID=UPI00204229EC|nr:M15 family metallopeptidase [Neobacillus cucumis]MCM3729757.1 M15 family metallopeptidase [Neobacillus cucumis]
MTKLPLMMVLTMVIGFPLAGCSLKQNFVESQPTSPSNNVMNEKNLSNKKSIEVVANPSAIPVLVNKYNKLPDSYKPSDLVAPDIPFIFKERVEKRMMRSSAARAIEKLFAGAKEDGVRLLGVSAYRSHAAQTALFNHYVSVDGVKAAKTYSAVPGTSEHETGLAIDVTGGDGKCAAEDCFAGTAAAKWLEKHADEFGFIIRYPKGKDSITGYQYEPWHLRYVGKTAAQEITSRKITLEEYQETIQVNK